MQFSIGKVQRFERKMANGRIKFVRFTTFIVLRVCALERGVHCDK